MENYRLPDKFIWELMQLPESGMGYQRVNIKFSDGKVLNDVIVLNCEILKIDNSIKVDLDKIVEIKLSK
ncbi:MAG: hypothetical protein LPJ98_13185 [Cyclobacteriaceae bacterium]|nr:hypothetical protein [Cyclobacteriaceae bacterium]